MSTQKKIPPVKYSKLDSTKVSFSDLEKNERSKAQKIAYPRYLHKKHGLTNLVIQTPAIQITQYGIPSIGEYYKDDADRAFLKMPIDPNQKESVVLQKKLESIDKLAGDKLKKAILGKNYKKFEYTPLVRTPMEKLDDDEDDNAEKKEKFKYFKAKIDTDYNSGEVKTLVYRKLSEEEAKSQGKKRELIKGIETITDLTKYVTYNSTVKLIMMANKLWAANSPDKHGDYGYGIGLKVLQIEVEVTENKNSVKANYSTDAFIEESDEEEEAQLEDDNEEDNDEDNEDDDDDDDEDDEEEDDEEEEVEPVKKSKSKSKSGKKKKSASSSA
jgi:hypothetical protein